MATEAFHWPHAKIAEYLRLLCFALAYVRAPFAHTQEYSDPLGHGGPFHGHATHGHDHPDGLSIGAYDPDDDARILDAFKIVKSSTSKVLLALPSAVVPIPLAITAVLIHGITPRGHDPPRSFLLSCPRSPCLNSCLKRESCHGFWCPDLARAAPIEWCKGFSLLHLIKTTG